MDSKTSKNILNPKYKKVIFVSFPRSGHHLLTDMIIDIHDSVTQTSHNYCEYYNCCNVSPCAYGKIFCKNHDFDLKLQTNDEYFYVIQYRLSSYEQLQAYYNYSVKHAGYKGTIEKFIENQKKYYWGWMAKWVTDTMNYKNFYFLNYESLVENPKKHIKNLCKHLFNKKIDSELIKNVIAKKDISYKNKWNFIPQSKFDKIMDAK